MEFFEVLRHFEVLHDLADVQECLFIPLLMSRFDNNKALRWRNPLIHHIRDPILRSGFAAIERAVNNYEGSDLPAGRYADEPVEYIGGRLKITLQIPRPKDDSDEKFDEESWEHYEDLLEGEGGAEAVFNKFLAAHKKVQAERDRIFDEEIAPIIAENFVKLMTFYIFGGNNEKKRVFLDPTLVSNYSPNKELLVTVRPLQPVEPVSREWIKEFHIEIIFPLLKKIKAIIKSGITTYRTKHLEHALFSTNIQNQLDFLNPVVISTPLGNQELRNPREEDKELRKKLLSHLNERIEYYHKVIWWNMDKERRYMLLDGFTAPNSNGRSIASVVENRLFGIVGNCLVMPVSRGIHLDPTYRQDRKDPIDLLQLYAPTTPVPPTRISLPTRGVFSEAVMGSCNSCEKKDDSRFWKYEESPCLDQPTSILPISTESRRAEPGDLKAKDFALPIIAMQNAPSLPDPTGMAAAFNLLGTPNIFKDITGLDQNQKNAIAALTANVEASKFYAQKAAELAAVKGHALKAMELAESKGISENMDKTINKIKELMAEGHMDEETGKKHIDNIIRGSYGGSQSGAQTTQKFNDKGLDIVDETRKQGGEANISTDDGSLFVNTSSGGGMTFGNLASHILDWYGANLDGSTNKQDIHIDQKQLTLLREFLYNNMAGSEAYIWADKGYKKIKFQIHRVIFNTGKSFNELVTLFNNFDKIVDPTVVECQKIVGGAELKVNDEFRWRVSAVSPYQNAIAVAIGAIVGGLISLKSMPIPLILSILAKRRFDVRIIKINNTAEVFDFTAQTLSDHPYAGVRTWRLKKGTNSGEYMLETVEVNTFPWLLDYVAEEITQGEDALKTWERFLTRFVENAQGNITDNSLIKGVTNYENHWFTLENLSEVKRVMSEYPEQAAEFKRMYPPPVNVQI
jgi:hypothetical protein